jgi:predicted Rossmann fold nucleotide-binding protein DprA/Smf involved in DNA uptake
MEMLGPVIAALYGGNGSLTQIRLARPMQILSCLKKAMAAESELSWNDVIEILTKDNFIREAQILSDPKAQQSAFRMIEDGKVMTIGCSCYPKHLFSTLGINAPPIFWISDPSLRALQPWNIGNEKSGICISAVGCRVPLSIGSSIAKEVGLWAAEKGYLAVSGGADGVDTAFGKAAFGAGGDVVHILPHGLGSMKKDLWGWAISTCPPNESFSSGRAMERNNLIYSFGQMTVVCSARYRQGGSWLGATNALKAKRPVVFANWTSTGAVADLPEHTGGTYGLAQRALENLGARPIFLDIQTYREKIRPELESAFDWSKSELAGAINTGLFQN